MTHNDTPPSRRSFLQGTATVAATALGVGLLGPSPAQAKYKSTTLTYDNIPGTGDVKVLNYALALEALETQLYSQSYARLTTGGTDNFGVKIPGLGVSADADDVVFCRRLVMTEVEHRRFLDEALGSASILKAAPFSTARFDFGISKLSRAQVMSLIHTAESTGTMAYLGAIPFLSTKNYLQVAASIQGVEARHSTQSALLLRNLFGDDIAVAPAPDDNNGKESTLSPNQTLAAVSKFIFLNT